jgi:hypothetical protein
VDVAAGLFSYFRALAVTRTNQTALSKAAPENAFAGNLSMNETTVPVRILSGAFFHAITPRPWMYRRGVFVDANLTGLPRRNSVTICYLPTSRRNFQSTKALFFFHSSGDHNPQGIKAEDDVDADHWPSP